MNLSRTDKFLRGLATGYLTLGANILFTAASVPLALAYLSREEFGAWALAQQISGYLLLLDFGMYSAVSRVVADKKDAVHGGEYGALLLTGGLIFLIQAFLILGLGSLLAWFGPDLFRLPTSLVGPFRATLLVLAVTTALSLCLRSLGIPLWAFQRMDVINLCMTTNLLLGLVFLWIGFHSGWGILSLALAGLPGVVVTGLVYYRTCRRSGHYPRRGCWGRPSLPVLSRCLVFGRDIFLISLGTQLANASQIMVISRSLGLEQAAVFSVVTKTYFLAQQLGNKVVQNSVAGLTEIFVRGERQTFFNRSIHIFLLVAASAFWMGTVLVLTNSAFVDFWTSSKIQSAAALDCWLGGLLLASALLFACTEFFMAQGNLLPIRFVRLGEGLFILSGCFLGAQFFGLPGVLGASLAVTSASLGFCFYRLAKRSAGFFSRMMPILGKGIFLLFLTVLLRLLLPEILTSVILLLSLFIGWTLLVGWLVWFWLLPSALRQEVGGVFCKFCRGFFRAILTKRGALEK